MIVIDYKSKDAAEIFATSLEETGFAVIENSPIPLDLIDKVYSDWGDFFAQSELAKREFEFTSKTHDGFISSSLSETAKGEKVKDSKEFYHYYMA